MQSHSNFLNILEPLLSRVSKVGLDGHDMCCLQAVCTTTRNMVDWGYLKRLYICNKNHGTLHELPKSEWSRPCQFCNKHTYYFDVTTDENACLLCQKKFFMTRKTAIRTYRLTLEDLCHLNRFRIDSWTTALRIRDISGVAILKHGGPRRMKLLTSARAREGKAFQRRMQSLGRLRLGHQMEQQLLHIGIKGYLRNGWGGIARIRQMFYAADRFTKLYERLSVDAKLAVDTNLNLKDDFIRWNQTDNWFLRSLSIYVSSSADFRLPKTKS